MWTLFKQYFWALLKEKTALPVVFLTGLSLLNLLIINGFFQSSNKLHITLAQASVNTSETSLMITESALKSNGADADLYDSNSFIYNKFLKTNLMIPTTGKNWGVLHGHNGVDIADACGKNVYAAEEGLVMEALGSGWNGGYGKYLVIEHPTGVKTKYGHASKILAKIGSYVLQGDPIALIGNTGLTHGMTGCHLHFEVLGAANPFARK